MFAVRRREKPSRTKQAQRKLIANLMAGDGSVTSYSRRFFLLCPKSRPRPRGRAGGGGCLMERLWYD